MFEAILLISSYPGRLNSNYKVINNTILQRKKNTSTFNKKVNIRLHNYLHNYKYNTVRTMCKKDYKQSIYK